MRKTLAAAACVAAASTVVLATPSASHAASAGQLCNTNSAALLYDSPTTGYTVPAGALVRILDYRGPYHYLARWNGHVGQLERSRVIQSSCYDQ